MNNPQQHPSILDLVERRGIKAPRVLLRDPSGAPATPQQALRRTGRYEIIGEIASGGVGAILRARDIDVGRDVAIKVLHEKHLDNPELIQRLIEEAQIGGQLQHPAIVPVYEIGLDERDVPFIAMKLVKGETLASLLQNRGEPGEGQRRYLRYFLQACQAMAYAHSRGVIHRDLKPSNLMVGSYGEVMILDWGFAKVLARGGIADENRASLYQQDITRIETVRSSEAAAESIEGSLMGTPAYMPPEQALGQIDDLDKRSDVFSLGAILCEILTGTPPYGLDPNEVLNRSARGDVDEARERLDGCGADKDLVQTCKSCLAPLRKDRPQNAEVLANAIAADLEATEQRARRMEIAALRERKAAAKAKADAMALQAKAAAARTEATEEKARAEKAKQEAKRERASAMQASRARRQVMLIAAAAFLVVLLGGGGFLLNRNLGRARERELRQAMEQGINRAQTLRTNGELAESAVTAQQVVELARQGDADAELLARAESILDTVTAEREAGVAEATRRKREATLIEALDGCRARRSEIFDAAATDRLYKAALIRFGINPGGNAMSVGALVRECFDPQPIIDALDDLAWLRAVRRKEGETDWTRPLQIADEADEDPWRADVRAALLRGSRSRISVLAETPPAEIPVESARLLAVALGILGEEEKALEYLTRAQLAHPGDPWMLSLLVHYHDRLSPSSEAGARAAHALVALRPENVGFRLSLALIAGRAGDLDAAQVHGSAALAAAPNMAEAHALRAQTLEWSGRGKEALPIWRKAMELDPQSSWSRVRLGLALLAKRDAQGALRECLAAAELSGHDPEVQLALAKAAYSCNQLSDARAACQAALREGGESADVYRTLGLVFLAAGQLDTASTNLELARKLAPADPFVQNTTGLVLLARREHAAARTAFARAANARRAPRAAAWANLAAVLLEQEDLRFCVNACREVEAAGHSEALSPWAVGFTSSGKSPLDQSIDLLRGVIEKNANYAYAHHRLGVALEKKGRYADAIESCRTALKLDPDYGHCLQTLTWIYCTCPQQFHRDSKAALELAQRLQTVRLHPKEEVAQTLGLALYRAGDYAAAAKELQSSVQARGGGSAWDWYFLAMVRWKLGNEKIAERWLAKAQAWTDANAREDVALQRIRLEAEQLLGQS